MASIYVANTNEQAVAVGGIINFGGIVRRQGKVYDVSGGNLIIKCAPNELHDITINTTIAATEAGVITLSLYKDGVAVPGAVTSKTVGIGSTYCLNLSDILVRTACCGESVITAVVSGVEATVTNATITARG